MQLDQDYLGLWCQFEQKLHEVQQTAHKMAAMASQIATIVEAMEEWDQVTLYELRANGLQNVLRHGHSHRQAGSEELHYPSFQDNLH